MSKVSMMFKIVSLLQTRYIISASELAQILDTSTRNIKAYIESLRMSGVPIEGLSGKTGGYFLNEVYALSPPKLDEIEYSALLLAEEFLIKKNGFIYENEIKTAFAKIKSGQGEIMGESDLIDKPNMSDSRGKADITQKTKVVLYSVQQAILNRKCIEIIYDNPIKKQKTVRKLDPYNLIFRESSWYVIGLCHLRNQVRMFKLMRIEDIKIIEEIFCLPAGYSVQSYLRDTFTLIKGKEYVVEIQFFHPASVWVSEKQWLPSQKIMQLKDDSIIFKARVDGLKEIKKWVLGYGKLAKVIKPQELVEQVVEEVAGVRELYVKAREERDTEVKV